VTRHTRPDAAGQPPVSARRTAAEPQPNAAARIIERTGALLTGHFRLTSGRHSGEYFQCARVLERPEDAEELGRLLADRFRGERVDVVVAPALGGVIIGHEVARALGVRFLFAERQDGRMTLRRGFALEAGQRVLIIEDVVTTGGSVKEVAELALSAGAELVGFGFIVDRSTSDPGLAPRSEALVRRAAESFEPGECPLCREGVPVVKPGSRQDA
jgi:orotate phosphoribosyltransferase